MPDERPIVEQEFDTHMTYPEMVCPYCGTEQSDSWEYDGGGMGTCGECGKDFELEVDTFTYYTTRKNVRR